MTETWSLEQRIERLEQQLGDRSPDVVTPNYLTQDAQGNVGANFSGHVAAQGVDLPAGAAVQSPSVDRVRWLRASDGAVVADVIGVESGTPNPSDQLLLSAYRQAADHWAYAALQAVEPSQPNFPVVADVVARSNPVPVGGDPRASVVADAFSDDNTRQQSVLLIDGNAKSSFLKLTSRNNVAVSFGVDTTAANGSSVVTKAINHTLGRVPALALFGIQTGAQGASSLFVYHVASTANTITVNYVPGGTFAGNYNLGWAVIG